MTTAKRTQARKAIDMVNRLFAVSTFLQRAGTRQVARWGLTQSQFTVLVEIARSRDLAQKDVLGELLLEKSNLSKIIRKLQQMELIHVDVQKSDRRMSILNATEKGKKLARDCMAELDKMKVAFAAPLRPQELEHVLSAIDHLEKLTHSHRAGSTKSKGA
jgi:DNA-binding MarR family transcriptional regulator